MTDVQDRAVDIEVDTSAVPFRVTDELLIPAERYYSTEFFELEKKLWLHTWQHACHETEIPNPGDFTEYKILDKSVMLIRQTDGSVKGFVNACRHRGTALACGTGTFRAEQVVCPFHGWRWNLDGSNSYIYAKSGFRPDLVEKSEVDLPEVRVARRWGFVWINLDQDAAPFEQTHHGVGPALDAVGFEKMHVNWWHQIEFEANWKVAQEAFFEGYHVMQAHPEMAMFIRDDDYNAFAYAGYASDPQGHAWLSAKAFDDLGLERRYDLTGQKSSAEAYLATIQTMWQGSQSQTNARQVEIAEELVATIPHEEFFAEYFTRVYADAAQRHVPLPPPSAESTGHWTKFPHFTGVSGVGCALVYRARPHATDPNKCSFDFWSLEIPPEGTPVRRPQIAADDAPTWDDLWFVQQDASNIERMQTGLRNDAHTHNRVATDLERMIVNWHQSLDRLLASYR